MANRNLEATWTYHDATKHSYWSVRSSTHYLDWSNQPVPFKIYRTLPAMSLSLHQTGDAASGIAALSAISQPLFVAPEGEAAVPDLKALAQILYFSAGITKKKTYPGGEIHFRAASCTGALYEVELYLVCGNLPDLGQVYTTSGQPTSHCASCARGTTAKCYYGLRPGSRAA